MLRDVVDYLDRADIGRPPAGVPTSDSFVPERHAVEAALAALLADP